MLHRDVTDDEHSLEILSLLKVKSSPFPLTEMQTQFHLWSVNEPQLDFGLYFNARSNSHLRNLAVQASLLSSMEFISFT